MECKRLRIADIGGWAECNLGITDHSPVQKIYSDMLARNTNIGHRDVILNVLSFVVGVENKL